LKLTSHLPRSPGVYLFCGHRDEVLYVGKATNLRQRVRSYFGSDDRRKIGPMLRETQTVRHLDLPDPLSAAVIESRLIASALPRYNRAGTRADKYCYIRLDTDSAWPRLAIVREPARTGIHLGPLPSRTMATLVIDAIISALPLRRCSIRLGRSHVPSPDAVPCGAAQLGVAQCPCAGIADSMSYDAAVRTAAQTLGGDPSVVAEALEMKMSRLAAQQRFEEAAHVRDRLGALHGAVRRHRLVEALRGARRCEVRRGDVTWVIDRARLVDVVVAGSAGQSLPVAAPAAVDSDRPLGRQQIDEALCLARHFDKLASQVDVVACTGTWSFPIDVSPTPS
jgi:DNA polymerase-3 subunit epsilon